MKAEDLYRLMEHPEKLTEETLPQLKLIVDEFPYFSIARLLYLKNLAKLNDVRFGSALKKMAVCVPDRRKLFMLIEGEHFGLHLASVDEKEQAGQSDAFSLIDAFLSNQKQAVEEKESPLFEPSASVDYLHWSLSETHTRTDETPDVPLQHQDLIDSFIEKDRQRKRMDEPEEEMLSEEPVAYSLPEGKNDLPEGETELHRPLNDSYFTETLAHIYIKQKRYEKALLIIKNLNLKNPEKNAYFADQIRFLEKLIINTKK